MITGQNRGWMEHLNVQQKAPIQGVPGFADGGAVDPNMLLQLLSGRMDPNSTEHGQSQGAAPGPTTAVDSRSSTTAGPRKRAPGSPPSPPMWKSLNSF